MFPWPSPLCAGRAAPRLTRRPRPPAPAPAAPSRPGSSAESAAYPEPALPAPPSGLECTHARSVVGNRPNPLSRPRQPQRHRPRSNRNTPSNASSASPCTSAETTGARPGAGTRANVRQRHGRDLLVRIAFRIIDGRARSREESPASPEQTAERKLQLKVNGYKCCFLKGTVSVVPQVLSHQRGFSRCGQDLHSSEDPWVYRYLCLRETLSS